MLVHPQPYCNGSLYVPTLTGADGSVASMMASGSPASYCSANGVAHAASTRPAWVCTRSTSWAADGRQDHLPLAQESGCCRVGHVPELVAAEHRTVTAAGLDSDRGDVPGEEGGGDRSDHDVLGRRELGVLHDADHGGCGGV